MANKTFHRVRFSSYIITGIHRSTPALVWVGRNEIHWSKPYYTLHSQGCLRQWQKAWERDMPNISYYKLLVQSRCEMMPTAGCWYQ